MAESYRSYSRRSETPSSSSSGGSYHSQSNSPHATTPGSYSYYATPSSGQQSPQYGHYQPQPQARASQGYGHQRTSSGHAHSPYSGAPAYEPADERASKRQRSAAAAYGEYAQSQWAGTSAHGHHVSASRHANRGHPHSSTAGSSPPHHSYRNTHDPYGQQLYQSSSAVPSVGPSTSQDAHLYNPSRYSSHQPTSDEEQIDHPPTELPPRKYSGKSQFHQPKKPGKIPGSAMDYLPILEARFDRLESAIDKYVDYRGQRALSNSILPGLDESEGSSSREGSSKYSSSRH